MSSVDNQTTDDQSLSPPPLLTARRDSIVQRITQVVRRKSSVSHTARPLLTRTTSASNSDATTSENGVIGKFSLIVTNDPADYDIGSAIGYGSSATVHSAMFKPQNRMVAIKMIELELFGRNQIDELRVCVFVIAISLYMLSAHQIA
jgi:hypothetical protein